MATVDLNKSYIHQDCWYVIYTRPNFEKKVDAELRRIGMYTYLPLQKALRQWKNRKAWIETPLFRSYVFVKTNLKEKDRTYIVNGLLNYVRLGSKLAILSEEEIERIKQLCLYPGNIEIEFDHLIIGKKIEICSGILQGLTGYILEKNDNKKLRIHLEGLNCFATLVVDYDSFSFKYIS